MLLSDSSPTPYDLRFHFLGIPVRVHPGFWVLSLFLGSNQSPLGALAWVVAVFLSVLVHEMGHALLQRAFGCEQPSIVLYTFGGVAISPRAARAWWQRVLIALAGPAAGFFLASFLYVLVQQFGWPNHPFASALIGNMLWVNVAWGVLNLAPIWPLDGGQVSRELLTLFLPVSTGIIVSLWLSIVASAALAAYLYMLTGSIYNCLLFALLGYQSYQALDAYRRARGGW